MADFDGPTHNTQPKSMASEDFPATSSGSVGISFDDSTQSNQHTFLSATGVDHDSDDLS